MTTYGLLVFDGAQEPDFTGPWAVFTVFVARRYIQYEPRRQYLADQSC
jgi:hypothetical protein